MRKRAAEQLSAATAAMVIQGNIEAEAEAARLKAEAEAEAARLAAAEEERLAAEAAEKLAAEQAATDPNVWAVRAMVQGGCSGPLCPGAACWRNTFAALLPRRPVPRLADGSARSTAAAAWLRSRHEPLAGGAWAGACQHAWLRCRHKAPGW